MFNWIHKKTKEVISKDCYQKLSPVHQDHFTQSNSSVTHRVDESYDSAGSLLLSAAIGYEVGSMMNSAGSDSGSSFDSGSSSSSSSDFGGFGGGDSGGGGASGDF